MAGQAPPAPITRIPAGMTEDDVCEVFNNLTTDVIVGPITGHNYGAAAGGWVQFVFIHKDDVAELRNRYGTHFLPERVVS